MSPPAPQMSLLCARDGCRDFGAVIYDATEVPRKNAPDIGINSPCFYIHPTQRIRGAGQVWRPLLPSKKSTRASAFSARGGVMDMGPSL